jgi:valyl-tRNA synthetase
MRNFANKVWNIARFVLQNKRKPETTYHKPIVKHKDDKWILRELEKTIKSVTNNLENYKLNQASEDIYEFLWHKFADIYIEKSKSRKAEAQPVLEYILMSSLKLLHPFMPFLTETIWQTHFAKNKKDLLMLSSWPKF